MKLSRSSYRRLVIVACVGVAICSLSWMTFHSKPKTFVVWMGQLYRPGPDDYPGAIASLHELPPADWTEPWLRSKIPTVILTARGAYINGAPAPVPFDGVISTLASMSNDQWPCGRLIYFVPFQPGLPDKSAPLETVQKIIDELKEAGIAYPSFAGRD